MKEKVKNYLFCLCALAMCLMFALAVFFKSCNSVNAASIQLGSNITYNEGQTLYTSINNVEWGLQINRGNSTSIYQLVMVPYTQSSTYNYMMLGRNCSNQGYTDIYLTLSCTSLYYVPLTTGTVSSNSSVSSSAPIHFTFYDGDGVFGTDYYIQQSSFYNYNSTTPLATNVEWKQIGYNYADGYILGYKEGALNSYNELYYNACLVNGLSNCSPTYFNGISNLTTSYVLNTISTLFGYTDLYTPVEIYDFIKSKYNSNYNICLSRSSNCVSWTNTSYDLSNIETGINAYITNTNIINSALNYDSAYAAGRADGVVVGVEEGKTIGYSQGFIAGQEAEDIVGNAVLSVASTPLMILSGMLNFNIFGFNVLGLVLGLFTFVLVLWILKKVF